MKKLLLFILVLNICLFAFKRTKYTPIKYNFTKSQKQLLDSIQHKAFLYFVNETNPDLGIVRDRSADYSPASIASTGFGVTAWIVGVENKWIKREEAAKLTLNLLKFLKSAEHSEKVDATGYKGFYYHFLNMKTGKREWNCELSTIDTALLFAGLRAAANYYTNNSATEKEIRKLADELTEKAQWDWMLIKNGKYANTVSMGWDPKDGFHDMGWKGYNEALILYIMAAGTSLSNPDEVYSNWLKGYDWINAYGMKHVAYPPLFVHQYSEMFVDFRNITDKELIKEKIDYYENSKRATLIQQKYSIENPLKWKGYDSLTWGITACDGPGETFNTADRKYLSYAGRGTSGPKLSFCEDGTIAPTAAGGSIVFAPELVMKTLENMYNKYADKGLWGKYGFVDSFNPTANWYAKDFLGIDQGPIVIMIENLKTGLIWKIIAKDKYVKRGFERIKSFQNLK